MEKRPVINDTEEDWLTTVKVQLPRSVVTFLTDIAKFSKTWNTAEKIMAHEIMLATSAIADSPTDYVNTDTLIKYGIKSDN
jgi:hypothetical protein